MHDRLLFLTGFIIRTNGQARQQSAVWLKRHPRR
ncbi:hypothetical protein PANA5342_1545 [Pantoea ananatis LMG 5342]|nr:hypothetical protein PANA5342_1545 [Pantoea ananatis LMG 5342]